MPNGQMVLDALQAATSAIEDNRTKTENMHQDISRLASAVNDHNAHLDNLVRELSRTNDLHERELQFRMAEKEEKKKREELAVKKAAERKKQAEENRQNELAERNERKELAIKIGKGTWEFFKVPLGTLITAAVAWIVYNYFGTPH